VTLGIRSRLLLVSLVLIVVASLASGLYLENQLRSLLENRLEADLLRLVRTASETVASSGATDPAALDALAERLGDAMSARVSILGPDGRGLGDSHLSLAELDDLEARTRPPEVAEALARGLGSSRRPGPTGDLELLYVAVPTRIVGREAVVRVGLPLRQIDDEIWKLRGFVLLAGLVGIVVAAMMSALASHLISRTFRALVERARALARGERGRINIRSSDEIGTLAGSLNRMSDDLELAVSTLAGERDRFQTVLEGMGDAVLTVDGRFRITLANPTAMQYLGLQSSPAGRPLYEVIRVPELQDVLARPELGEPTSFEFELAAPIPRRLFTRITPLKGGDGFVFVMHDVTEVRRLETMRRDFVANVSHELRTPISVVLANAETLLDGALGDRVQAERFVRAIHSNAERLSLLIGDLLDLSSIEAGRYPLGPRATAVDEVVRSAAETLGPAFRERRHVLEADLPQGLSVLADPAALEQVLINLLDNAVKYTPPGGRIRVVAKTGPHQVRIEVADDGPGIEPRHRERVFERFYRVDPGRSRELGGTGLGLAIVKHLVDAMGGRVGVEPVTPHGSCFWLSLPRAVNDQGGERSRGATATGHAP
jgi:two-component system phosphate regulon sensor histidine kinase PhoR